MAVDFSLDLRALIERAKGKAELVATKTVLAVGTSLVMKSPVGDPSLWKSKPPKEYVGGHFRANWQYGFNVPLSGQIDDIDVSGQETINNIGNQLNTSGTGGVHFIVNNLPYAVALEYGHSTQAPEGIVGVTTVEFEDYVNQAVAESQ